MDTDTKKAPKLRAGTILIVVLLVGGGVLLWEDVGKDRVLPKRWATVEEKCIYRSGQLSAALVKGTLASHGIKVIVALTADDPNDRDQAAEEKAAVELGIELLRFPLSGDGTGDHRQYAEAVAAIVQAKRQGKPVLVHCAAGVQRTGGVLACYRLLVERRIPADVFQEMRDHGWDPKDNPALLTYLNENLPALAVILLEKGVIDKVPDPLPVLPTPK